MPQNSQNTLSPLAIKHYNNFKEVICSYLKHIKFIMNAGIMTCIPTDPEFTKSKLLNYITVDIVIPQKPLPIPHISRATSFTKNVKCNSILIHHCLMHPSESTF